MTKTNQSAVAQPIEEMEQNPWKSIPLEDYETHMGHEDVLQLQALNELIRNQLVVWQPEGVAILGIAGGNGLEHIDLNKTHEVFGYDINKAYLEACRARYGQMGSQLKLSGEDLSAETSKLPEVNLILAYLIIEYMGISAFVSLLERSPLKLGTRLSCVIQKDGDACFVSSSPVTSLNVLEFYHQTIEEHLLIEALGSCGWSVEERGETLLQGGKALIRLNFCKEDHTTMGKEGMAQVYLVEPSEDWLSAFEAFRKASPDLPEVYAPEPVVGQGVVTVLKNQEKGLGLPDGYVPASHYWLGRTRGAEKEVVGIANLRHGLNDFLSFRGGHIGYFIKASERRKGYAKRLLKLLIPCCRRWGVDTALITCDDENMGSYKTIEDNGGVLVSTDVDPDGIRFRRYHIKAGE